MEALGIAQVGIRSMREGLSRMNVGCHPLIFYQRVRPFLSGWKANPTLPDGVVYEVRAQRESMPFLEILGCLVALNCVAQSHPVARIILHPAVYNFLCWRGR